MQDSKLVVLRSEAENNVVADEVEMNSVLNF